MASRHHTTARSRVAPIAALAAVLSIAGATVVTADVKPGTIAPDFSAVDTNGTTQSLSSLKGKTVVLEWTNHLCPYSVKHYRSGNMQKLQKAAAADGVVWISIVSSAPGRQGYVTAAQANKLTKRRKANPGAVILDPKGTIGRLYSARTTPHMFVIDAAGKTAYMGAIDSRPSANPADVKGARNYVSDALAALKSGKPVKTTVTRAYGCSVKYGPRSS
ncbi:MAG: redoxin family protein [Hyphomicrobiaceae bacterium]